MGNMWAQSWGNLADILRPYPDKPTTDVTDAMVAAGWTPKIMFEKADEFFQSMGLEPMTKVGEEESPPANFETHTDTTAYLFSL